MLLLTLRDLGYRSKRVIVVVVGTTLVFTLLLIMTGLTEQFSREPRETVRAIGGDAWIVRAGATGAFTSSATLDPGIASRIEGVGRADPIITARHGLLLPAGPLDIVVVGFADQGLGTPAITAGRLPQQPAEAVLDESAGLGIGADATIGPVTYRVVGLTSDATLFAGMPIAFMSLGDAQDLLYRGSPIVSAIVVDRAPTSIPRGFAALPVEAIEEDAMRPLENAVSSVNFVRLLLWLVSAMIIGGVVFLSAMERRRDFAVMKAVGAETRWLLGSLALQGLLIALLSAGLASLAQLVLAPAFPLKVRVTAAALLQLHAVAVAVALVASVGGMRQVARTDPAAAFGGQGA